MYVVYRADEVIDDWIGRELLDEGLVGGTNEFPFEAD